MESIENIAAGYAASGGYGGAAGAAGLDNLDSDDRGIAQLAAAQQQVNRMNDIAYGRGQNFSNRADLNRGIVSFIDRFGPKSLDRATFNQLRGITPQNPGGRNTLAARIATGLKNMGIGTGQVETNPDAGRLTGTVFGKKNELGETVLMSDGKSMGIDADQYYSGRSGSDIGRPELQTYQDKYGYADPATRAVNRQYDQFLNPLNDPSLPGFNPDVGVLGKGEVRPGLQTTAFTDRSGTPTALGPVVTYDRDFSGADNLAMTLAPGGVGFLARAMANPVSGIRGQELPAAALAPTEEMLARGETSGGMMRSFNEALGQGIGALSNAGQGLMNAGTNISEAFTNAVRNTAEGLANAGVNTAEALDAAIRNTTEEFTNAGVNVMDLFRTDPKPQVQRQLDDAPLDENMYGRGMFDLAAPLSQTATVPRSSITRNIQEQPVNPATAATIEQLDSLGPYDMNRGFDERGSNIDRMLDDREAQQREGLEAQRRAREAEINAGPYGLTPTEQIILDSSVRSNFPDTIQIADARTYRSPFQGETGLFRAGKGKGQTLYGGQKEGSFLDQDYLDQLRQLRDKAINAGQSVFNYFTT